MRKALVIAFVMIAMAVVAFEADNTLGSWNYNASESIPAGMSATTTTAMVAVRYRDPTRRI
jgi:hypothetical protein